MSPQRGPAGRQRAAGSWARSSGAIRSRNACHPQREDSGEREKKLGFGDPPHIPRAPGREGTAPPGPGPRALHGAGLSRPREREGETLTHFPRRLLKQLLGRTTLWKNQMSLYAP